MSMSFLTFLAENTPIDADRQAAVRDAFRNVHDPNHPWEPVQWVLTVAGLLTLMLLLLGISRWIQQNAKRSRPMRIFHRLATELGVAGADQVLLVRIARIGGNCFPRR